MANQPKTEKEGVFLKVADWVSEKMGSPFNITTWLVLVIIWTCVFAFGSPHVASGTWLPSWFTSQGFNFPLNLITTVAELFIGFLVAAATNRAQNALTKLIQHMSHVMDQQDRMEKQDLELMKENTDLTRQIHDLTQSIHDTVVKETTTPKK